MNGNGFSSEDDDDLCLILGFEEEPPWDEEVTLTVTRRELAVICQALDVMETAVDAVRLWDFEDEEMGAKRMEHFAPEEIHDLGLRLDRDVR